MYLDSIPRFVLVAGGYILDFKVLSYSSFEEKYYFLYNFFNY